MSTANRENEFVTLDEVLLELEAMRERLNEDVKKIAPPKHHAAINAGIDAAMDDLVESLKDDIGRQNEDGS